MFLTCIFLLMVILYIIYNVHHGYLEAFISTNFSHLYNIHQKSFPVDALLDEKSLSNISDIASDWFTEDEIKEIKKSYNNVKIEEVTVDESCCLP